MVALLIRICHAAHLNTVAKHIPRFILYAIKCSTHEPYLQNSLLSANEVQKRFI